MNNWKNPVESNWQQSNITLPIPPPPIPPSFPPSNLPPPPIPPPPVPPQFLTSLPTFSNQRCQNPGFLQGQRWSTHILNYGPPEAQQWTHKNVEQKHPPLSPNGQTFVDRWISSKNIIKRTKKEATASNIKIWAMKEKLNTTQNLIKELENDGRTLAVMVKTVSPSEWNQKCSEIEEKKKMLTTLLNELQLSKEDLKTINKKYLNRSKKRARLKRQSEQRKMQKEEEKVKTRNLHFQIDKWQNEMRDEVEREQREEELQREADAVLWGVTQRKAETRRQIALLSALLELRQVRAQRVTAAGNPVSQSHMETFNTVIEKLKNMWTKQLDECLLEEQALRGMLTKADIKDDPVKTYKKLVVKEWELALFATTGSLDSNLADDQLLEIRRSWDQFAVPEATVISSTVPPGWVLPVPPSDHHWRTLLTYT